MRTEEEEQIRRNKRAKYIRERMQSDDALRLAHNLRMRNYRANKREELMRLRELSKTLKTSKTNPTST
tara:strand:+ start:1711 stop:1914 length:204 start_codon:yes stop_codon:yes gene_type:complete